jgi:uncharacterized phage-associated protein
MNIRFKPNPQKIIEVIVWIAQRLPQSDRYTVLKTLFYGDKYHLQKYGRPVTGDTYIKMSFGPVACYAYNIIKRDSFLPRDILIAADEAFDNSHGDEKYPSVVVKRTPDMDWFSETDIECLEEAAQHCSGKGFSSLMDETHREQAWIQAEMNQQMDFALLIDEETPNRDELLKYISETSPCQSV